MMEDFKKVRAEIDALRGAGETETIYTASTSNGPVLEDAKKSLE